MRVTKYWSVAREYTLAAAADRLEKEREKHPQFDYTILCNRRGGAAALVVARVEDVEVDLEGAAASVGPEPDFADFALRNSADYRHEYNLWSARWNVELGKFKDMIYSKVKPRADHS